MREIDARESGTTIFEVTVSSAIVAIVIAVGLTSFIAAQRNQSYVSARTSALDSLRVSMQMLTKEVRQAVSIDPTSVGTSITMKTYVTGTSQPVQVRYYVNGTTLYRQQGTNASRGIQDRLASTQVFTYTPGVVGAQIVIVNLKVHPRHAPDTVVQLTSEVRLRNRGRA